MPRPRVLTFNFHEPYLCLMAKTGFDFTVGLYRDPPLARPWQTQFRPIPKNMTLVDEPLWRADLMAGRFDVIVAHNETNAANLFAYDVPKLLVCHNRRTFLRTTVTSEQGDPDALFRELISRLRERFGFVFISESKMLDYGVPGKVILPGVDLDDYGGYAGETPEVLRVGNMMRARNLMFDVGFQEAVCAGLPNRVVGCDPQIPGAREAASFDELLRFFRTRRCLLHVTREAYEDGYNLSMLEAMACGMPVVALANPTSPLTDGHDGFLSYDAGVLREHVRDLLEDPRGARTMGERARETVAAKFPISAFAEKWRAAIEEAAEAGPRSGIPRISPAAAACLPPETPGEAPFEKGGYYRNTRLDLALHVPVTAARVLDVGCGGGDFGLAIKERGVREVYGVEISERAWRVAKRTLDDAVLGDIERIELPFPESHFDCIVFGDVLEHLIDPGAALHRTLRHLTPDGIVVIAFPNVRYYEVIAMLCSGFWRYDDAGIMDRSHLRFFTAIEMRRLLRETGLEVLYTEPLCIADGQALPRKPDGALTIGRLTIAGVSDDDYRDLRTFQYVVVAGRPGADRLARARDALESGRPEAALALASDAVGVDETARRLIQAGSLARIGQLDKSERVYRDLLQLAPDHFQAQAELGILLVAMNCVAEAEPLLEQALAVLPEHDRARGALGLVRLTQGRDEEAFACLCAALNANFQNRALIAPLVEVAEALRRLDDIADILRRFADFYAGDAALGLNCARLAIAIGHDNEARDRLERILLLNPRDIEAKKLLDNLAGREE